MSSLSIICTASDAGPDSGGSAIVSADWAPLFFLEVMLPFFFFVRKAGSIE